MSNYDNSNRGVMFRNDKKTTDNHPDYKGKGNYNGTDFEVAGWIKTSKDGKKKFMSLAFSEPYVKPEADQPPSNVPDMPDPNDDLPF